jgi:hypothetical protein
VAHSKVRPFRDAAGKLKTRPGGLGFIVMDKSAAVVAILSLGEDQIVAGHQIRVQSFERPKANDSAYNGSVASTATTANGTATSGCRSSSDGRSDSCTNGKSETSSSANEASGKSDSDYGSGGSGLEK